MTLSLPPIAIEVVEVARWSIASNVTTANVPLPGNAQPGDLLYTIMVSDGSTAVTIPTGWDTVANVLGSGSAVRLAVAARLVDGTEGATVLWRWASSERAAAHTYLIRNQFADDFDIAIRGVPVDSSTTWTPQSTFLTFDPGHEALVISGAGVDNTNSLVVWPSDRVVWQNQIRDTATGSGGVVLGSATYRQYVGSRGAIVSEKADLSGSTNQANGRVTFGATILGVRRSLGFAVGDPPTQWATGPALAGGVTASASVQDASAAPSASLSGTITTPASAIGADASTSAGVSGTAAPPAPSIAGTAGAAVGFAGAVVGGAPSVSAVLGLPLPAAAALSGGISTSAPAVFAALTGPIVPPPTNTGTASGRVIGPSLGAGRSIRFANRPPAGS